MISVAEAETRVFENMTLGSTVSVPIADVHGEILREPIVADRPFPPYHRVAMDGIALKLESWNRGRHVFSVSGIQRAGESRRTLEDPEACLEVMTGAVLPEGCDCVVPLENIELRNGTATLRDSQSVVSMHNVHTMGCDRDQGAVLLDAGTAMFGPQCAVAATVGKATVRVAKRPKVAIVSTGDELVPVDKIPKPHQIRGSNSYALSACLQQAGFADLEADHLRDNEGEIRLRLGALLDSCSVLLVCGGVSAGRYDLVPKVLGDLGVRELFHKVKQRPGMPLWFGRGAGGQAVFGLPGNPVAGVVCCHRYVVPALWKAMGAVVRSAQQRPSLALAEEITFGRALTLFKPITIRVFENGERGAAPVKMGGSGDLAGLAESDGFVELPADQDVFERGILVPLWLWSEPYGQIGLQ